jgi:hypothetical protein
MSIRASCHATVLARKNYRGPPGGQDRRRDRCGRGCRNNHSGTGPIPGQSGLARSSQEADLAAAARIRNKRFARWRRRKLTSRWLCWRGTCRMIALISPCRAAARDDTAVAILLSKHQRAKIGEVHRQGPAIAPSLRRTNARWKREIPPRAKPWLWYISKPNGAPRRRRRGGHRLKNSCFACTG